MSIQAVNEELARQDSIQGAFTRFSNSIRNHVGQDDPHVPHEGSVVALTVLPMLHALDWRVLREEDGDRYIETYCEFKTRTIQADVALLSRDGLPRVLIEVKRPGKEDLGHKKARHQLFGYVHDACAIGAPLVRAALTDGVDWLIWSIAQDGTHIEPDPEEVNFGSKDAGSRLDRLLARASLPNLNKLESPPLAAQATPLSSDIWTWRTENEPHPKLGRVEVVGENGEDARVWRVQVYAWVPRLTAREFAKDHEIPNPEVLRFIPEKCSDCGREMRRGHCCSGELPRTWPFRFAER